MARVLLIDGDSKTIETIGGIVRLAGHEFSGAMAAQEGLQLASRFDADVAFTELKLPDMPGLQLMRKLRTHMPWTAWVVITAHPSFESAIEALRAGACDWLNKPALDSDILAAITRALTRQLGNETRYLQLQTAEPHGVRRLAEAAVLFIASARDRPRLRDVGREIGHASGCIRNWCRTAKVEARVFRDFVRALRVVYRLQAKPGRCETNLVEIVDDRTLKRFRLRSGGTEKQLPSTVEAFLERQQFIRDPEFVTAIRGALKSIKIAKETEPPPSVHVAPITPTTDRPRACRVE